MTQPIPLTLTLAIDGGDTLVMPVVLPALNRLPAAIQGFWDLADQPVAFTLTVTPEA